MYDLQIKETNTNNKPTKVKSFFVPSLSLDHFRIAT